MALRKGHLLVIFFILVLSLAPLAAAHSSWYSQEDDWYNNIRKPKIKYGGKKVYKKKYRGVYNGKPSHDDDDEGGGYKNEGNAPPPAYKKKPYKPISPVYKPKPGNPPTYTKPATQPSPDIKPPYNKKKPYPSPKLVVPETPTPKTPIYTASSSQNEWLDPHNAARAEVGLPPMVWSAEVAQFAQSWANQRQASGCGLEHSGGSYGENIFWGSAGGYGPAECVAAWVSEKEYYNYDANSCTGGQDCGHYTQIIWANSVRLGCAKVQCDSGDVFMTCNYDPPGNYIGNKPY